MPTRTFEVDRLRADDEPAVVGALARAFYDDPLFGFFLPQHVRQTKGLLSFMAAGLADAKPFDEVWVAHTDGKVACTAVWLPPGAYPRGPRRELMSLARSLPTFVHAGRRIPASLRLLQEVDRAHHDIDTPHFYLAILGTDPLYQRTGAGSAALQPVLDRCDEQGLGAYLETQKEANLAYYARHRFEVVRKLDVRGCPSLWTLFREPATT